MSEPEEGIKGLLVAAGIGTFAATTGWSIVVGRMIDAPDTLVCITHTGGQPANPQWLVDYPSVQVRVRGTENGYVAAKAKARAVQQALLGLPSQDIGGDRWVSISAIGDIQWIGTDAKQRPEFTLNFRIIMEPGSGTYRESL